MSVNPRMEACTSNAAAAQARSMGEARMWRAMWDLYEGGVRLSEPGELQIAVSAMPQLDQVRRAALEEVP